MEKINASAGTARWQAYAATAGAITMALTAFHHAYGAIVFDTPWRLHVVPVAILTCMAFVALSRMRTRASAVLLKGLLAGIVIGWIGLFEGFYNHGVRLALWMIDSEGRPFQALFGGGPYAPPRDWVFEFTGLLQVVPAAWTASVLAHRVRDA